MVHRARRRRGVSSPVVAALAVGIVCAWSTGCTSRSAPPKPPSLAGATGQSVPLHPRAVSSAQPDVIAAPAASASAPASLAPVWVLAPHPDDETLMAAPLLERLASNGQRVLVNVMTNGDLGCQRDGFRRQAETVAAMARFHVPETAIRFLAYPDGALQLLANEPLPLRERRQPDGSCTLSTGTYGTRGVGGQDVHRARTGQPGAYTHEAAVEDLVALLEADQPSDITTAHPLDEHPDHAETYLLLRRALESARLKTIPVLHRALVHLGPCWPNGSGVSKPCPAVNALGQRFQPLPPPFTAYHPDERLLNADGGKLALSAIGDYPSQLTRPLAEDWLASFARAEFGFYTEQLQQDGAVLRPGRTVRAQSFDCAPARRCSGPLQADTESTVTVATAKVARLNWPSLSPMTLRLTPAAVSIERADQRPPLRVRVPAGSAKQRHFSLWAHPVPHHGPAVELELRADSQLLAVLVLPAAIDPRQPPTLTLSEAP